MKTDIDSNTLTITGKAVDPANLRDSLAHKTKKNVQLLSPVLPTTKSDEKKAFEKKPKAAGTPVEPKDTSTPASKDDKNTREVKEK